MPPVIDLPNCAVYCGDALETLRRFPDKVVQCCVTSPPYWGLRDYGTATWEGGDPACDHRPPDEAGNTTKPTAGQREHAGRFTGSSCWKCGARRIDQQLGLEPTPDLYVARLVEIFREVRRVLKDDGTLWLNLGDSYFGSWGNYGGQNRSNGTQRQRPVGSLTHQKAYDGLEKWRPPAAQERLGDLKPKDLVGIPWLVAFALRADGWYLRQDIIWCLSGGTWLYARTQKGDMPIMVRDLFRLRPETVRLWNGAKWTRLRGMSKSKRNGSEIELVLRSGERISCTSTHRFPTNRGLLNAGEIRLGDVLESCRLPEPETPKQCVIDEDAAWLAGLYIAEGSRSGDTIQIAGHTKEETRLQRLRAISAKFGGSCTRSINGNNMNIRIYGRMLNAIIDELVTGKTAKNKGFAPVVWRYSDRFLRSMLEGYLSGDGAQDGNRWRLGFTRNSTLERDLRTVCARLGYTLTLNASFVGYNGRQMPTFRGEIRMERSGHRNEKNRNEIVKIRKARCREVYDLGVEDEPHLFALASGILTHNSKPNPMPESVHDRCTKSHEYLFLLSKAERYWFDQEAIKEPAVGKSRHDLTGPGYHAPGQAPNSGNRKPLRSDIESRHRSQIQGGQTLQMDPDGRRNRRDVWFIPTSPFPEAHFATFPAALVTPCILAGAPPSSLVLDPFAGSGTTLAVANSLGRRAVGIELQPSYLPMIERRLAVTAKIDG